MKHHRYRNGALLVLAIFLRATLALGQTRAHLAPGLEVTTANDGLHETAYRLLINVANAPKGGLRVISLGPNSPAARMVRADDHNQIGGLEPGDVITRVDGARINSITEYYDAMKTSTGKLTLTVTDRNTGKGIDWEVQPARIVVPTDADDDPNDQNRTVHLLLIGLTNDSAIGQLVTKDLEMLETVFRKSLDSARLDMKIIKGDDCNARFIIQAVRDLGTRSRQQDSMMVYYDGHGAYDPQYAKDDPSAGHFFAIPPPADSAANEGGDLLRKTLFDNLVAQPGRLKILFSDACNVRQTASPAKQLRYEEREFTVHGPTNLEQLLLYHRGFVDVNSASLDQVSCSNLFCSAFAELIPQNREWPIFLRELSKKSNSDYVAWRLKQLPNSDDPYILAQTEMKPAVFRIQVEKDKLSSGPSRVVHQMVLTVPGEQGKTSL